ncbi:MAG: M13 family metallopeptidase [Maricaulis sp.]|nr:M13 family metallopeptidase [Maricaulis sp.]MDG2043605.1 M13 family metallopeptidase [Maricaulis sp.]
MKKYLLTSVCVALLAACSPTTDGASTDTTPETVALTGEATLGTWGIETEFVSEAVEAGDDFFSHVNQGWIDTAEIPDGFSSNGAFLNLYLESEERINSIIMDSVENGGEAGSATQQIGDLYASYMDRDRIEELGLTPIQEELDAVLAASTHDEVARWFGRPVHRSPVGLFVGLDSGNPERYLVQLTQGGLGLPNRDYYLDDGETFVAYREAYVSYIESIFTLANVDDARSRAEAVMAIETALANVHWTPVERRDSVANYDLQTRDALEAYAPQFPWASFFEELGVEGETEFVVNTNTAVQATAQVFAEQSAADWSSYLGFHFINAQTSRLPQAFDDASFDFFSRTLNGIEEQRPREQRAVPFVSGRFGENIGQVYVERYFPSAYKDQMVELVEYLRRAYADRLEILEWMDDETRVEAMDKLERFIPKIGYPDYWRDYSSIEIDAGDLIGNTRRIGAWNWEDSRSRLSGPRRAWEWFMSPQTVNAYYSPDRNEIVFPAAILQAPFFDPFADPAVNFAAIGGVIGHEMGHGFDDQGSQQDGRGVLRDWWTPFSRAAFDERTGNLSAQYSAFSPLEGENVNGDLTLGENIGDLGGLSIALHAYRMYQEDHGAAETLDGFTPEQRFFMSWAQVWRGIRTNESLLNQLRADPHSPGQYRVNGVVRNMDAWYEAFGVTEEHDLYLPPEERITIW